MAAGAKDKLLDRLEKLPLSFNLKIKHLTQPRAKCLLKKLQREFECQEYDYQEEKRRYYNLITYLYYFCRNIDEAENCNYNALTMDPESIVALGNKAMLYHLEGRCDTYCQEIENTVQMAEKLCSNRVKLLQAKAEIAYSYARFGLMYYKNAETMYEEVLDKVKDEDKLPSFLWQYGCGLIIRRYLGAHGNSSVLDDRVKRCAVLLSEVAKKDKIPRFRARAWAELAILQQTHCKLRNTLFPKEFRNLSADDMFAIAEKANQNVDDIPTLEQCTRNLKNTGKDEDRENILRQSLCRKESGRAYQLLALLLVKKFMKKQRLQNTNSRQDQTICIPYCEEILEIVHLFDSSIKTQVNFSAMQHKAKFLYHIGQFKDAVVAFDEVYKSLQTTEIQPAELDRDVLIFCHIYHAKCLLALSRNGGTITRAKELLTSAIEMSFDLRTSHARCRSPSYHSTDEAVDELPTMTKLQKDAIAEMRYLLQLGERTADCIIEEIAMCELLRDSDSVFELMDELKEKQIEIPPNQQEQIAEHFIKLKLFDMGLLLLKQLILLDIWPKNKQQFAITAQVDGAMEALAKGHSVLAGNRLRDAFDFRFSDQDNANEEKVHVFFLANKCNQDLTRRLKQSFCELTKLNITSCFDLMPGSQLLHELDESMQESSVIAILFDTDDLTHEDYDTNVFKKSVHMALSTQMKYKPSKVLVVIKPSEGTDIHSLLRDAPRLQLGNDFQQKKLKYLCEFLLLALLN